MQCDIGRSGMLCGTCQSNLSLSLGSSHCIPCSTRWSTVLAVLTIAFFAGIALVALLLVLNLTVAAGTLNGIVFYANVMAANTSTFLPFSKPNFATVFISWINLEIGFDICFFAGMDAYWKTLLQLAFPMYVILLVVMVIFISERSTKFARLVAKRNPVATLATLILLSYTKFLSTIIASLSFAILKYPDNSRRILWLPDATVKYLQGKHIILFILAIAILLAGFIYTMLLFSWQWILKYQDRKIFMWTRHQKLCYFIEPYHAPYTFEQRYWTGLLLFSRVILYLISAVNIIGDPRVSLASTNILIGLLILVKGVLKKKIYKNWSIDLMEMIIYFNIISLAVLTLLTESIKIQGTFAYCSIMITFASFLIVVLFHVVRHTCLFSVIEITNTALAKLQTYRKNFHSRPARPPNTEEHCQLLITHSIVEFPTVASEELRPAADVQSLNTSTDTATLKSNMTDCEQCLTYDMDLINPS